MSETETVEAAGLLLFTGNDPNGSPLQPEHFLLLRHADRWDLPKGHREPDESLIQTALRETEEETGIPPDCIERIGGFSFAIDYSVTYHLPIPTTHQKRVTYFLGRVAQRHEIRCTEHLGYQWFPWSPPHKLQPQTIDPLLAAAQDFFASPSVNQ